METGRQSALKRLIRKYEYLLEDWAEVEEIAKSANQGMSAELHKHMPPEIKPSDFEVEESEEDEKSSEENNTDADLKKLFRKVVVLCHPDKLSEDLSESQRLERLNLYEKAVVAHDESNWALMIIIAIKLGVELPESAEEKVDEITEETEKLEQKINSTTGSIAWQWYHSVGEERESIVQRYLTLLKASKTGKNSKKESKESKLILGVGHPRTGTGYTAKLLQSWGLDIGHETMGKDGTVDWSLAPGARSLWQDVDFKSYDWKHIIYCVRDPRESIPSIVYTENVGKSSEIFRKKMGVIYTRSEIANAIMSIIKWDEYITKLNPSVIFRIEDESNKLFEYLNKSGVKVSWNDSVIGKKQNTREHKSWLDLMSERTYYIPGTHKKRINEFCEKYGYDPLF